MGPLIPFLVTSALGFKVRVDPLLACFLAYKQQIPQIHLWCDTCWLYGGQHGIRAFLIHILADMSTSVGGGSGLKPTTVCATCSKHGTVEASNMTGPCFRFRVPVCGLQVPVFCNASPFFVMCHFFRSAPTPTRTCCVMRECITQKSDALQNTGTHKPASWVSNWYPKLKTRTHAICRGVMRDKDFGFALTALRGLLLLL